MRLAKEPFNAISDETLRRQIADFCETCPEPALFHIGLYALADKWKIPRAQVLNAFFEGASAGIFLLEWLFHCAVCGGILNETGALCGAHSEDHCPVCAVDSKNTLNKNVEVFFSIHPQQYELPIDYKEAYKREAAEAVEKNHLFAWKTGVTVYGSDAVQSTVFRSVFGGDVLPPGQSLELENAAILFTDIKGSTQMYTDLGDANAFKLVNEHFAVLFDVIARNGGVPVKTIGDAVMGVFLKSSGALAAALECQTAMRELSGSRESSEKIKLKIGLHSGDALVVTLNGRLDYFGTAVNFASRIQSIARPCEVTFSEPIIKKKENIALLRQYTQTVGRSVRAFGGLDGRYPVYHMLFSDEE